LRKIFYLLLPLTLFLFSIPDFVSANDNSSADERVIVIFKDKADKKAVTNVKGMVKKQYKNVKALAVTATKASIKRLAANPDVLSIEKDKVVHIKSQFTDWGIQQIQASTAWKSGLTGKGVNISVIDTGVADHPDLSIAGGVSVVSYTTSYVDDNGHGTHVAGIIGAKNNEIGTVGVAPEANLFAVKAMDNSGSGYVSDIIAGIDWSIQNKMDIINLSLGLSTDSYALHDAVNKAYNNGIIVVAAAGNDGTPDGYGDTVDYPAKYPNVIAVSATDLNNNRGIFSATGDAVQVAAPGVDIVSTYLHGSYARASGTSMAAPFTTGTLALLKEANLALNNLTLREKLYNSTLDIGMPGKDSFYGHGLIQAPVLVQPAKSLVPTVKNIVTTVRTNKSLYFSREKVSLVVTVSDDSGNKLRNAKIGLAVTSPKGAITKFKGNTNNQGVFKFTIITSAKSPKGRYTIKTDTSLAGYKSSSAQTTYNLK
jgi:minor extracellular protease Epr